MPPKRSRPAEADEVDEHPHAKSSSMRTIPTDEDWEGEPE